MASHLPSQRGDIRPFSRRTNSSIISSSFPACARGQAQNVHPISVIFCGFSPKGNMRACPVGLFLRTTLNWSSAQNRSVRVVAGFCVHPDAFLEDLGVCFKNKYKRKYKYKCKYNKTICKRWLLCTLRLFFRRPERVFQEQIQKWKQIQMQIQQNYLPEWLLCTPRRFFRRPEGVFQEQIQMQIKYKCKFKCKCSKTICQGGFFVNPEPFLKKCEWRLDLSAICF